MRIAILSDIHANLEALEAVSADIAEKNADRVLCLGDNIGYGPDPDEVVMHLRRHGYDSVRGNHEYALDDSRARRWLNFQAAENNAVTASLLSVENMAYCCELPFHVDVGAGYFVHGYPPDSVFRYLNRQSDERVVALFGTRPTMCYFVGHTHRLEKVVVRGGSVVRSTLTRGTIQLDAGSGYIFNCGSVGQPRDGDNRAKYLLWDLSRLEVETRFVRYDAATTQKKIRQRGFPEIYATRLG